MKKILTILLCLLISVSLFAVEDVRSKGMGGYHVTDYSDIYTIKKNPASLAFSGKHKLILNIQIDAAGPLQDIYEVGEDVLASTENYDDSENSDEEASSTDISGELLSKVTTLIEENNGFATSSNISPLLNFGFSNKGFGFLASTDIYTDINIPSVTNVGLNVGFNGNAELGYGFNFDLGANDIAVGVSADFFSNLLNVGINGSLTQLLGGTESEESSILDSLPITSMKGFSITSGLHYRYADFLNVGIVWNNMISSTNTANVLIDPETQEVNFDFDNGTKSKLDSKLAVGFGVKVPINFIITSMNIYVDHENILDLFVSDKIVKNPILGLNAGVEAVLLKAFSFRLGINESYLAAGFGLRLGSFNIETAVYGSELGLEPGDRPQLNTSISVSFKK